MTPMIIFLAFFLGGLVKGVLGMGLPTVGIALLVLVMPPSQAASLLLIPSFFTNVWQLFSGPSLKQLLRRLWPMMVSLSICTVFATQWLVSPGNDWVRILLGGSLIAYVIFAMRGLNIRVPRGREKLYSSLAGLFTGLVTGSTGIFVLPAVPFLQALNLEKNTLIQALGMSFTVSTVALGVGLSMHGKLQLVDIGSSALMLIPALAGVFVGAQLRQRLNECTFRRIFFYGLLVLGFHALITGMM